MLFIKVGMYINTAVTYSGTQSGCPPREVAVFISLGSYVNCVYSIRTLSPTYTMVWALHFRLAYLPVKGGSVQNGLSSVEKRVNYSGTFS